MTDSSCIFCRIIEGDAPAHIVWEDPEHVAFLDINPIAPGHTLLVPRAHVEWADQLSAEAHAQLFARARELSRPVAVAAGAPHTGIAVEGYGVSHVHVHLVPVWRAGDLDPCRQKAADPAALRTEAEALRGAIAQAVPEHDREKKFYTNPNSPAEIP